MSDSGVRIGVINSFDADTGSASIYYPDRNDEVTSEMPVFAPFGISQKLEKGDNVLVLHLSNGQEAGIVMGVFGADEEADTGISITGGNMVFQDVNGSISLKDIMDKINEGE